LVTGKPFLKGGGAVLQLQNVTKRYGDKTALRNISFQVGEGEVLGLLGRNGAGKSTLMNLATGYLPCTEGTVLVGGIDMTQEPRKAKRHMGYLPEQPPVYDTMAVADYLRFVGKIKGVPRARLSEEVDDICERVGITRMRNSLIRNLSKGYRQRVGIAQAMLGNPELLVLDEPTAGLDPVQIVEIRELIRSFGRSRTVLISSHILAEIAEICERVLIIREGELVADHKVEELGKSATGGMLHVRITAGTDRCRPVLEALSGLTGLKQLRARETGAADFECTYTDSAFRQKLFDAVAENGWRLLLMQPAEANIEEAFLRLTSEQNPIEPAKEGTP